MPATSSGRMGAVPDDPSTPISDDLEAQFGVGYYHRSPQSAGVGAPFTIPTWDPDGPVRRRQCGELEHQPVLQEPARTRSVPNSIGSDGGNANPAGTAPPVLTLNQRCSAESVRTISVRAGINF